MKIAVARFKSNTSDVFVTIHRRNWYGKWKPTEFSKIKPNDVVYCEKPDGSLVMDEDGRSLIKAGSVQLEPTDFTFYLFGKFLNQK